MYINEHFNIEANIIRLSYFSLNLILSCCNFVVVMVETIDISHTPQLFDIHLFTHIIYIWVL